MADNWKLNGNYFEACNCEAPCPCTFFNDPTYGDCTVLVAWHINQGNFNQAKLDNLNTVMAIYSPENMGKGNLKVALYIDDRADQAQKDALVNIFTGKAGSVFGAIAPLIGEVWGVSPAKIEFTASGKNRGLKVQNMIEIEAENFQGQEGKNVTIENMPFTLVPGFPTVAAKTTKVSFRDHGQNWSFSGKNSFNSPFQYSS